MKISYECTNGAIAGAMTDSLNWLAANAAPGTIVNLSFGPNDPNCYGQTDSALEEAIEDAVAAGVLFFTSAGNHDCDISIYNWKSIPESFVVGGLMDVTSDPFIDDDEDRKWASSNWGANISTWAPAANVASLTDDDFSQCSPPTCARNGTSMSSPMVAGLAAIACEWAAGDCAIVDVLDLYDDFRDAGTTGTVLDTDGSTLSGSPSRVIWQQW